jgi:hypothetical protein
MAIARCQTCPFPKANKPPAYSKEPYYPVGYPQSGLVCGTKDCERDAVIWLKTDEEEQYINGQRVFDLRTNSAKVRVS